MEGALKSSIPCFCFDDLQYWKSLYRIHFNAPLLSQAPDSTLPLVSNPSPNKLLQVKISIFVSNFSVTASPGMLSLSPLK